MEFTVNTNTPIVSSHPSLVSLYMIGWESIVTKMFKDLPLFFSPKYIIYKDFNWEERTRSHRSIRRSEVRSRTRKSFVKTTTAVYFFIPPDILRGFRVKSFLIRIVPFDVSPYSLKLVLYEIHVVTCLKESPRTQLFYRFELWTSVIFDSK